MNESEKSRKASDSGKSLPEGPARRVVSADELLAGQREVWLQHGSDLYRLLVTRNGKLLLQK